MQEEPTKTSECHDLKNLQYKTLLMNGKKNVFIPHKKSESAKVEAILEQEMNTVKSVSWSRLDRIDKIAKLQKYAEKYCNENKLSETDLCSLKVYLKAAVDRNRLQKVREVKYNKETMEVEGITYLTFNKSTRKFTLKRSDKRISTLSSLGTGTKTRKKRGKNPKELNDKLK